MTIQRVLFATKVGEPDYTEQLITEVEDRIPAATEWAKANGFDRIRVAEINLSVRPDFLAIEIFNRAIQQIFNRAIQQTTDPDQIAKLELCREYFTNPTFKAALEEFSFALNEDRKAKQKAEGK